jgi:hypothetical protein
MTRVPGITTRNANNWVDRGSPPQPILARILAGLFARNEENDRAWLAEHSAAVVGMVAADATEVQLVGYLRTVERDLGEPRRDPLAMRMTADALWHVAKVAMVRDLAERLLRGEIPPNDPTPDRLGHWLAERLLTPEEMAEFEREAGDDPYQPPAH